MSWLQITGPKLHQSSSAPRNTALGTRKLNKTFSRKPRLWKDLVKGEEVGMKRSSEGGRSGMKLRKAEDTSVQRAKGRMCEEHMETPEDKVCDSWEMERVPGFQRSSSWFLPEKYFISCSLISVELLIV